jgi:rubrerythrin
MTAGLDFDSLFYAHERVRWSPERDLPPLTDVRRHLIDRDLLDAVVVLARTEFSSIPAMLDLLRIFAADPDITAWLSIWFGEEVRHHLLLRQYAVAAGADPARMLPPVQRPDLGSPPPVATLAVNVIGEIRTCRLYAAMAAESREPVLAALLRRIAGDEGRHARGFAHYASKITAADPGAVSVVLRVGELWCDPDRGLEASNPAAENYQDEVTAAAMAALQQRWVDRDRERAAVLRAFTELTGRDLASPADFARRKEAS